MKKKRWGRLPAEFKEQAVEKMKKSANVSALAVELGVPRRQLYRWQRNWNWPGRLRRRRRTARTTS